MIRPDRHLRIPDRLADRLATFRGALVWRRTWQTVTWSLLIALIAWWTVAFADRLIDVPANARLFVLVAALAAIATAMVGWTISLWTTRASRHLAELIRRQDPLFGDHLIGALELAESQQEQRRSKTLCAAALEQVADEMANRDHRTWLPPDRLRRDLTTVGVLGGAVLIVAIGLPDLVSSTSWRLATPLSRVPRFTFTRVETIAPIWIVPRGEASERDLRLADESPWKPARAVLSFDGQRVTANRQSDAGYHVPIPPLLEPTHATLRIGDHLDPIRLDPKPRSTLAELQARVALPDYLRPREPDGGVSFEIFDGVLNLLPGSTAQVSVQSSRQLQSAFVNGRTVPVDRDRFEFVMDATESNGKRVSLSWIDRFGLRSGEDQFVRIEAIADEAPTLIAEIPDIPQRVLLDQQLSFALNAADDFSIRQVGMDWNAGDQQGSRVLGGDTTRQITTNESSQIEPHSEAYQAVFQANAFGIDSGKVTLRFWVEDDLPSRQRVFSQPVSFNVLTADEHAVWIAESFHRWQQSAMDVRDRELSLFERNRELLQTDSEQRDKAWRSALEQQARAEQQNARMLESVSEQGMELLRQAARNDQVDSQTVESLAGTVQTLEGIAAEKMPRVAKLLEEAAKAEEDRFSALADMESSQAAKPKAPGDGNQETEDAPSKDEQNAAPRLSLAGTTVVDSTRKPGPKEKPESDKQLSQAVDDQSDLVAEFDTVAEEMRKLLGEMEGSTFVKRLKSISRLQDRIATKLARDIADHFGGQESKQVDSIILADANESAQRLRTVLDDLEAFYDRREIEHFGAVLSEIKQLRTLQRLKELAEQLTESPGRSIAVAEFWADNLDRFADDLIDPRSEEPPPSDPQKQASLPPKTILEVLRILETQVNLREQTRVAEQGRQAMERNAYMAEAIRLSEAEDLLRDRLDVVVEGLEAMPNGLLNYGGEIEVLSAASAAMADATETLVSPDTGPVAIAAQTEAIELLLRSQKADPESGGGGSGSAGQGSGGTTKQAAAELLGRGLNALAKNREADTEISIGRRLERVPESWRDGLQQYFNRLEQRRSEQNEPGVQ
jgi:hypothetical protein